MIYRFTCQRCKVRVIATKRGGRNRTLCRGCMRERAAAALGRSEVDRRLRVIA